MSKELQVYTNKSLVAAPAGNLDAYIQWANSIPMLSLEEEQELATRLQNHNDLSAAQRLVTSHIKYVVKVARSYMGYGLMLGDLIQEGTIGLMKAVKRYQPGKGVRLVSFAVHWIKAEIHEFVLKNWRIVKIATTKAQRKLFFNLRSKKTGNNWLTAEEIEDIAKDLNVKPSEVVTMEKRLHSSDTPLEMPRSDQDEKSLLPAPIDYLEASDSDPSFLLENSNWDDYTRERFFHAFSSLDERSKDILTQRWLIEGEEKATLLDLAKKYEISSERVRQIEKNAIMQLRSQIVDNSSF